MQLYFEFTVELTCTKRILTLLSSFKFFKLNILSFKLNIRRAMALPSIALCFIIFINILHLNIAEFPRFEHKSNGEDGSLSFLVVGDWGRRGEFNQSRVALQMGRIGEELDIDFVISTGDNFYDNGLRGEKDPAFVESFTNIYTANSLQKQWYSVLGNHDYRGDVEAQLSPYLRQIDNRWFCLRSFIVNTEIVEIFFVDTSPFVTEYFDIPNEHSYDWRGVTPVKRYINNLLIDVESALKKSKAKWKIVVGHHAIRSIGHHGDTQQLVHHLLPILQDNDVDLYINGHDHCLEHISDGKSGAGSKAWRGDVEETNRDGVQFFYDGQGFMSVQLLETEVGIIFYDVSGQLLHRWSTSKQPLAAM